MIGSAKRRRRERRKRRVTGRLDRLDGHEGLEGTLWDSFGRSWVCTFPPRLEPELARLWRRRVEAEGVGVAAAPGSAGKLDVERVRALEGPVEEAGRRFWAAPSLDQLALEQGVGPLATIDELLSVWEEERLERDPFEELMAERERRRMEASAARG